MGIARHIRQLAGESAVYGVAGIVSRLIAVVLIPLYTRVFTPEDYGVMSLVSTLIALVGMFVVLGLDNSAARWYYDSADPAQQRSTVASWFWCQVPLSAAIAVPMMLLAPWISSLICGSPEHAALIRLAAVALPFSSVATILGKWFRYQRRPIAAVTFGVGQMLTTTGMIVVLVVVCDRGLSGLFAAQLIASVLAAFVAIVLLRSSVSPLAFSWPRLKGMLRFGLPLVPAAIAFWLMTSANRFILNVYCDAHEVGLYAVATSLAGGVALAVGPFTQAWGPFAYSILNDKASGRVYSRVFELYSLSVCALCTATAIFAPLLLRVFTTPAYYPAASCVVFLAFACGLEGARFIAGLGSGIAKQSLPAAISIGIGAAVNLALNFALIPFLQKEGAGLATMLGYFCSVAYLFAASQKRHPIPYRWSSSLLCGGLSWAIVIVNWCCIPEAGMWPWALRAGLLFLFLPLGHWLGLLRWSHARELFSLRRVETAASVSQPVSGT
ncbi:MAG TPA: oligosaccharide flippase family protein [Sedimentisphaerales bacterium]|nr:oligosaccharide flippase family protein [Sedimentisphaerales bacterium]